MSDRKPLEKAEIDSMVGSMISDAAGYQDTVLDRDRGKALDYYHARPFGGEVDGRSNVVSTDVRDSVQDTLPGLMKIFTGPDRYVEFRAEGEEDVEGARQATDYVNFILMEDNPGFKELLACFKDALVSRQGVIMWGWNDSEKVESWTLENQDADNILMLENDNTVDEIEVLEQDEETRLFKVRVTRRYTDGRVWIAAAPPEEIIFTPDARDDVEALMVGHRTTKRRSELRAMGFTEEVLDNVMGSGSTNQDSSLKFLDSAAKRLPKEDIQATFTRGSGDDSAGDILFITTYPYLDVDGDGIAELVRVLSLGTGNTVVEDPVSGLLATPVARRPFAFFVPDPEPHTIMGLGTYDYVKDLQEINSELQRGMLDSLGQTLFPRPIIKENSVNIPDVMNTKTGHPIRIKSKGEMTDYRVDATPFVGGAILPIIEMYSRIKDSRMGTVQGIGGLNPDALQSTTQTAVAAITEKASQRSEMLARIFAEMGMRTLMRGILETVIEKQDKPRVVRLRGEFVEIDPRPWASKFDVSVSVALGASLAEQRLQSLAAILQQQMAWVQQMGPNNPVATLDMIANTQRKMVEIAGFAAASEFFNALQKGFQVPEPPPKPTPEELIAQAQVAKVQADTQLEQAEEARRREDMVLKDDRERDKARVDAFLRAKELELRAQEIGAKFNLDLTRSQIEELVARRSE